MTSVLFKSPWTRLPDMMEYWRSGKAICRGAGAWGFRGRSRYVRAGEFFWNNSLQGDITIQEQYSIWTDDKAMGLYNPWESGPPHPEMSLPRQDAVTSYYHDISYSRTPTFPTWSLKLCMAFVHEMDWTAWDSRIPNIRRSTVPILGGHGVSTFNNPVILVRSLPLTIGHEYDTSKTRIAQSFELKAWTSQQIFANGYNWSKRAIWYSRNCSTRWKVAGFAWIIWSYTVVTFHDKQP